MEKKDFDKKVQELMAGFEEEYDPKSWNSFEKKLQFEEEMDELIRSSMESYEEPFNEEHWELLTHEIQRRRVRAIVKRTSEVVIILLLIMTAHNFLQFKGDSNSRSRDFIHLTALTESFPQINNKPNNGITRDISGREEISIQKYLEVSKFDDFKVINDLKTEQRPSYLLDEKQSIKDFVSTQKGISENTGNTSIGKISIQINEVVKLQIQTLSLENPVFELADSPLLQEVKNENGLWLGFVAGPDVNFINSPFDLNLLRSPIQSQSGTLTFGATLLKDIGLFELATAVLYSKKNYSPFRIREFVPSINQRYLETSLRSLEFEQIQIPLLVNIHSGRTSGWSMYGTVGLGFNIITNTLYDIETQVRSFSAAPTSSKGVENLNLRELPRGAFQAGTFGNNIYASAIAGFGIEKRIGNQYAFTLRTTYQRSLSKEINPVINRTQQIGMSLGVKVNLK
tara:strand:+ start:1749 stop:3113 length:1365 start_codon:yes stop_codon:yes gene_type:complete